MQLFNIYHNYGIYFNSIVNKIEYLIKYNKMESLVKDNTENSLYEIINKDIKRITSNYERNFIYFK